MFLPLGACYSVESALNTNPNPLPKRVVSAATVAFMIQVCYIYMWSAAFKTKSETWWPDGTAVYYSLSYDQYGTAFAGFLLSLPPELLKILTFSALIFEWVGPLLIFIPFRNSFFKIVAILSFILLHIGFGLSFHLGIFPFLSVTHWLPIIPSLVWDWGQKRMRNPEREGLRINYDRDCGFCKKVVHLLRTFLILPGTPLLVAQDNPSIYEDMVAQNSWVVEDWQGKRRFKWSAVVYIVSLSPIFWFLAPILRLPPLMALGTRIYEWIASHRRFMGNFTKPLKFRPLTIKSSLPLNVLVVFFLFLASIWNLRSFVRDDAWFVAVSQLADGSTVDIFREGQPVIWDKPTESDRNRLYKTMQWRQYFINLNRAIGRSVYGEFGQYLCQNWNQQHSSDQQIKSLQLYIMRERTVPPGEKQGIEKELIWQQNCL